MRKSFFTLSFLLYKKWKQRKTWLNITMQYLLTTFLGERVKQICIPDATWHMQFWERFITFILRQIHCYFCAMVICWHKISKIDTHLVFKWAKAKNLFSLEINQKFFVEFVNIICISRCGCQFWCLVIAFWAWKQLLGIGALFTLYRLPNSAYFQVSYTM